MIRKKPVRRTLAENLQKQKSTVRRHHIYFNASPHHPLIQERARWITLRVVSVLHKENMIGSRPPYPLAYYYPHRMSSVHRRLLRDMIPSGDSNVDLVIGVSCRNAKLKYSQPNTNLRPALRTSGPVRLIGRGVGGCPSQKSHAMQSCGFSFIFPTCNQG